MSDNSKPDPRALIDIERYPIDALSDPRTQTIITTAQRDLAAQNVCLLSDFITPEGVERLAAESEAASRQGFHRAASQTCYISQTNLQSPSIRAAFPFGGETAIIPTCPYRCA